MKTISKKTLLMFLLILLSTLTFGLTGLFNANINKIFASEGISVSADWGNPTDGIYSVDQKSGLTSKTKTLKVTITGKGLFSFSYLNTSGTLTITYQEKSKTLISATGNISSLTTVSIVLTEETNTITFACSSKGLWGANGTAKAGNFSIDRSYVPPFEEGEGTIDSPYIISTETQLQNMNSVLDAYYSLKNDITLTKKFTPIGDNTLPFSGTLYGNNFKIYNLNIDTGNYRGLFGATNGATIENLDIVNATISANSYAGILMGYAKNDTKVNNVNVNGILTSNGTYIGGLVGYADGVSGIKATNCVVSGEISTNVKATIGGLSGTGGTFTNCIVEATVSGVMTVGGLTGGYDTIRSTLDQIGGNSKFTNCFLTGEVKLIGEHNNNYPYFGIANGYGAWASFEYSNSGQRVTVDYTSSINVEEIMIFNCNASPNGINVTPQIKEDGYTFTQDITITKSYVGSSGAADLDETSVSGITGNYGGYVIRFKMANGTYKYLSTLNREEAKFQSKFDINLDNLTSYVDNFKNIEINQSLGTSKYKTETVSGVNISVFGAAKIDNANDFEHLSWIINGAIPTTFKNNLFYNARSVITISVDFQNADKNLDLTRLRYARIDGTNINLISEEEYTNNPSNCIILNTHNNQADGNILYGFYGFGKSEMYPYRGSLYGNNHILKVNMNFPNSYLMGIIAMSSEQSYTIKVENLTVDGIIAGGYRVGIVGMQDNYKRSGSLELNNVTNNATISAKNQVGSMIGEAQGEAVITLNNCTNNGNIIATNGSAGGLVGSLTQHSTYATVSLNNCTNNGNVTATTIAAGLVASTGLNINLAGTNINSAIILAPTAKQFTGSFIKNSTYNKTDSNSKLISLYTLIFNLNNIDFEVNSETYNTEQIGMAKVRIYEQETFENVTLEVKYSMVKNPIEIKPNAKTMQSVVVVPTRIELIESNVYNTTNSTWDIKGKVTFSDNSTINISLTPNIKESDLNSNKLVFINTTFTNDLYVVGEDIYASLYRITDGVKDYVTNAYELLNKTTGTNAEFLNLGTNVKNKFDSLTTELKSYSNDDRSRFNDYISNSIQNEKNTDVSNNILSVYYDNIVSSVDLSVLDNITVDYGTYNFTKELKFTMLSGKNVAKNIEYSFVKNGTLLVEATTNGVSFNVGDVVTYRLNKTINVGINKIDIKNIRFENKEFVYDNEEKTTTVSFSVLENDAVGYTLKFKGINKKEEKAKIVDDYEVEILSLTGNDAIFYNIPSSYTKGSIKITPIILKINVENNKTYIYNKQNQATNFTLSKLNESSYELVDSDYSVKYEGVDYSSSMKPINAGIYTATVSTGDNFSINGTNTFSFEILKKQITDVTCEDAFVYKKEIPEFTFTNFVGLVEDDQIEVSAYTIFDSKGQESNGINYGNYTLSIDKLSNDNYYVENLIKTFKVNKKEVEITFGGVLTSVYGEEIDYSKITLSVTKGEVYTGDELNIKITNFSSLVVGDYEIIAEYSNDNYNVTFVKAMFSITKRPMTINFVSKEFTYNSQDRISELKPTLSNVLEKDKENFVFELIYKDKVTSAFESAGDYTLILIENFVTNNYEISNKQSSYTIKQYEITLKPKNINKNFNQTISSQDFEIENVVLPLDDKINDIVEIQYLVYSGDDFVDITQTLDVKEYTIRLNVTAKSLFDNYIITLEEAILNIDERETYIVAHDIEKYYDEIAVDFSAKLYGVDNEEILNASFIYTYFINGEEVEEVKNVGNYIVVVKASAGDNNKECQASYNIIIKTNVISINLKNANITYNGEKYKEDFEYSMNKEIDISNKLSFKFLDKDKNVIDYILNSGDYLIEFSLNDNNLALNNSIFAIKIEKVNITIQINDRSIEYKADFDIQTSSYSIISGALIKNETLNLTYYIDNFKEVANSYNLKAINNSENYNVTILSGKFIVNKRQLIVNFAGKSQLEFNESYEYDELNATVENAVTQNAYIVYYLNDINQQITEIKDAGTYYLVVEILDAQNYMFKEFEENKITKKINVSKKLMNLVIDLQDKTYDKNPVILNGVTFNNNIVSHDLYFVEYYENDVLINVPQNAGTYKVKIVEKIDKNYQFTNNIKEFEILKRNVECSLENNQFYYNRDKVKPTVNLSNVIEGDDVKLDVTYLSSTDNFENVGTYSIQINGLVGIDSSNYNLTTTEDILYYVNKAFVEVSFDNLIFTFNNKQITINDLGISFDSEIEILDSDYLISTLPTFAGDHKITLICLNSGLKFSKEEFTITINKAEIENIVFEDNEVDFDNQYHSLSIDNLILENGIELNVEYSENSFKDAGTYIIEATLTNENYEDKILQAKLIINKISINVLVTNVDNFIYSSLPQGREIIGLDNLWYKDLIEYTYLGENFESKEKPSVVGEYKLLISSNYPNNISIENMENDFSISSKTLTLQNITSQSVNYTKTQVKYNVTLSGVVPFDEVDVEILYDNSLELPINAKNYVVTFGNLIGKDNKNYHLENKNITSNLIINPLNINVKAINLTSVYGEEDKELIYTSDSLLTGDEFTGNLVREQGKNVNSYVISQGTLTAGVNYKIDFTTGIYNITQREVVIKDFEKEFVYNTFSQIPVVEFDNILKTDGKVVKIVANGDTVNVGTYKLQLILLSTNYKFRDSNVFDITITQKDISDKIIGLVSYEKDYDEKSYTPFVLMDGEFDYLLSYEKNNQTVSQINNAGEYKVLVTLNSQNYKGQKEYKFVVNKIYHSDDIIQNLKVEISSESFKVLGLLNLEELANLSIDGKNFVKGNNIGNLKQNTKYNLTLKLDETENYKETIFELGEFITSKSGNDINIKILQILEEDIDITVVPEIKQVLIDYDLLSDIEKQNVNTENVEKVKEKLEEYMNTLYEEIVEAKSISDIVDLNRVNMLNKVSILTLFIGLGLIVEKRKKRDEK